MLKSKKYRDRAWLKNQYINEMKSINSIAKECSAGSSVISNWLKKHAICIRTRYETRRNTKLFHDKDWLQEQYIMLKKSCNEISEICNCSPVTIWSWLNKFKIHTRSRSESTKGRLVSKETRKKLSRLNTGRKVSIETRMKISKSCMGRKISNEVREKMSKAQLGRRHSTKTRRKQSASHYGNKNPAWKGGVSFEPYCSGFNEVLKEKIRNRDNRVCQQCGRSEILNGGKRLTVHHINGDKMDCRKSNLIAVCNSCNSKIDTIEKEFLIVTNIRK